MFWLPYGIDNKFNMIAFLLHYIYVYNSYFYALSVKEKPHSDIRPMHKPYVVDMDDIRHEDKKMLYINELIQLMANIFNECYIFSTERHNLRII